MDQTPEELTRLVRELDRRHEEAKLEFFIPNGKQEIFIKQVALSSKLTCLFIGGNGTGKTALLVNILGNIIWGCQNSYFNFPFFKGWKFPKRLRIGTESKNVESIGSIDTEIDIWWPKGRYEGFKAGKLYLSQYKSDTGFLVDKLSYEMEPKEWESSTLGMVVFDEPPPKDIFAATVSRMRQGGLILFFMTPLANSAWIDDDIISSSDRCDITCAEIEDNCKEHGNRGVLEHSHIKAMLDHMDQDEYEARALGKFIHLSNVIFGKAFNRKYHVISNNTEFPNGCQWGYTVDPHGSKPFAMGLWWVDYRGNIVFDSEYPLETFTKIKDCKMTLKDYVEIWRQWEQGRHVNQRIIDRHFANARDYRGRTLKQELEEDYKMQWDNSYNMENELEAGILKVKQYLSFDKTKPLDSLNQPKILIKERCHNIIRALERWSRNKTTFRPEENSPYKDHADIVRYTVMAEPKIYIPTGPIPLKARYAPGH